MLFKSSMPVWILIALGVAIANAEVIPTADRVDTGPLEAVERLDLTPVDLDVVAEEDEVRELQGLPSRFAIAEDVSLSPEDIGTWETLPDDGYLLWRLRITVPDALSLNLGFDNYHLPPGARLVLHPVEGRETAWEFTDQDNKEHGQLWTPVVLTDDLVVELTLPAASRDDYGLHLIHVGKGYRFFGEPQRDEPLWCMNDVICPEGDPWRDEINSVAVFMAMGQWNCSGVMVNNTAEDGTPYLLTAYHCGIGSANQATVVVYWNFQSPICGQQGGGTLADHQIGSIFRAKRAWSDFCLIELEDDPDPAWNVTYSGWDRSDADAEWAVGIHHPWAQEKSISFEDDPTTTTSALDYEVPGNGSNIRVEDWDDGSLWFHSSGSPLYNQDHRVIGQLYGGYASCENDSSSWYGRFSVSWDAADTPELSLHHWLDPLDENPMTLDLYAPYVDDLYVSPISGLVAEGIEGGPFSPSSLDFTILNRGDSTIEYLVTSDVPWIDLAGDTSGSLLPEENGSITVSINSVADGLPVDDYTGAVVFTNLTNGEGDTTRPVRLLVGSWGVKYSWNLDTDPGWTGEVDWAYGAPSGQGGDEAGYTDPNSGYTGNEVLGYNLLGDYTNNLPEYHLTTGAIDCSELTAVTLRFWRWLNVSHGGVDGLTQNDHASIHVSNDGVSWITVWENQLAVCDQLWEPVAYDISEVADGQESVYVRWTMGPTDGVLRYSGWNIDDIEILGLPLTAVDDRAQATIALSTAVPNPFNPQTTIMYEVPRDGHARLRIFDLRGRLATTLVDEVVEAGPHEATWNGRDDIGRDVPSGVYLSRLEVGGQVAHRRMTLIR